MAANVIAEIGINHDGDPEKARDLIRAAEASGCWAVKFQYRNLNRAYSQKPNEGDSSGSEIGDEIVRAEVFRNYLSPIEISDLASFAHNCGLKVGISFFIAEDFEDFSLAQHQLFDFYKTPSAELLNEELIEALLKTSKTVLISLGMHSESEVDGALGRIESSSNWIPMHCVSNYPVAPHNSRLGYIKHLKRTWHREVGYSSHDANWEASVIAVGLGASFIERHLTLDKSSAGLDHSSSSTPEEFSRLVQVCRDFDDMNLGDGPRVCNQGELLNRQNLGRSYFARTALRVGEVVDQKDFLYRSPMTGLDYRAFRTIQGKTLLKGLNQGEVLTVSHVAPNELTLSVEQIYFAKRQKLSIPVRLRDYSAVSTEIPVEAFEFHLSFEEVFGTNNHVEVKPGQRFSVHSPDYIDSQNLIDPFSEDENIKSKSLDCLGRVIEFADKLAKKSGYPVPIVNSLSSRTLRRQDFYPKVQDLFNRFSNEDTPMTLQWLPPFAWYFGGSIRIEQANAEVDVELLKQLNIPVTMDSSHLIMCRNFDGLNAVKVIQDLKDQIIHCHISDADGIDGEGTGFGDFNGKNFDVFSSLLALETFKVIEVWQGHLNSNEGFKKAIIELSSSHVQE